MVDTPLTKDQLYHLTENYGRFVIRDVRRGSLRFYQGQPLNKKIVFNINPQSVFTILGGLFVLYKLYKIKKDLGKKVTQANPFQNNINDFEETLNTWHKDPGASDEEEEEFASA